MGIIGQCPVALEEIFAEGGTVSRPGEFGSEDSPPGAAGSRAPSASGTSGSLHGRTPRARPGSFGHPLRLAPSGTPSGRSLGAPPPRFAPAAVGLADVSRHVPEEMVRLFRERLVLLARRLQESRRPAFLQQGDHR